MVYRELTRAERTTLNRFFDKWGAFDYFKEKNLLVKENAMREVYLISAKARKLALEHNPVLGGIKIGELKKQFWMSIEGASIIARHSDHKKIMVNEHAEALILYGRDIFGDSIIKHTNDFDENEIVLITNRHEEVIAIGRTRFPAMKVNKSGVTVSTITDRGAYLREENSATF